MDKILQKHNLPNFSLKERDNQIQISFASTDQVIFTIQNLSKKKTPCPGVF